MNKGIKLLVLLLGLTLIAGCDHSIKQDKVDNLVSEVDKVVLEISNKRNITAGELVQNDIKASGYDLSYAIKYEKIEGNSSACEAKITFFLKKDGIESKKRTVTITDFKVPSASATEQEKINEAVDKITLTVSEKESITVILQKNKCLLFLI